MSKSNWSNVTLTNKARSALRTAIREHPSASQVVAPGTRVSSLSKAELLELASKLSIDPTAVAAVPGADIVLSRPPFVPFAFSGIVEFDFTMGFLGKSITRKARVRYDHTPSWAYFDAQTSLEVTAPGEAGSYAFEVQSINEGVVHYTGDDAMERGRTLRRKHEAHWEPCNELTELGIWTDEMWDAFINCIEDDCRAQDRAHRQRAMEGVS